MFCPHWSAAVVGTSQLCRPPLCDFYHHFSITYQNKRKSFSPQKVCQRLRQNTGVVSMRACMRQCVRGCARHLARRGLTVDDRRHGEDHPVLIIDDGIDRFVPYDWQVVSEMAVLLKGREFATERLNRSRSSVLPLPPLPPSLPLHGSRDPRLSPNTAPSVPLPCTPWSGGEDETHNQRLNTTQTGARDNSVISAIQ